jgi:hypothetical protein
MKKNGKDIIIILIIIANFTLSLKLQQYKTNNIKFKTITGIYTNKKTKPLSIEL